MTAVFRSGWTPFQLDSTAGRNSDRSPNAPPGQPARATRYVRVHGQRVTAVQQHASVIALKPTCPQSGLRQPLARCFGPPRGSDIGLPALVDVAEERNT